MEPLKEAAEEAVDWLDNAIVCEEEFHRTDTVGSSMDYGEPDPSEADEATVAYWTHPFALLKEKINLAATVASMAPADNPDLDESGRLLAEHLEKGLRVLVGFCEIPQPKRARMEAEQAERTAGTRHRHGDLRQFLGGRQRCPPWLCSPRGALAPRD